MTVLFFAFLGLIFGSFGSVLVMRLPVEEGIGGRSRCLHCGTVLRTLNLIPLLSYIVQRGRCTRCEARIAMLYPALEMCSALIFILALMQASTMIEAFLEAFILWTLFLIAVVDTRTQTLPDSLNILLCALGVLAVFHRGSIDLLAILVGVGFLGVQWLVSHGRWVGSGDVFLMLGLGLAMPSLMHIILTLFVAYIVGAIVALILLITKKTSRTSHIAFGPFIVLGAFVAMVFGGRVMGILVP